MILSLCLSWSGCLFFCKLSLKVDLNSYTIVVFKVPSPERPAWSKARYVGNFTSYTKLSLANSTILHIWSFSFWLTLLEIEISEVNNSLLRLDSDGAHLVWRWSCWELNMAYFDGDTLTCQLSDFFGDWFRVFFFEWWIRVFLIIATHWEQRLRSHHKNKVAKYSYVFI